MELVYKKATIKDIEILTKSRVQVLIAANKLPENTNMLKKSHTNTIGKH